MSKRHPVLLFWGAVAAVVAGGLIAQFGFSGPLSADASAASKAAKSAPIAVRAGRDCGVGWTGGSAGHFTFAIHNDSIASVEVYLENAKTRAVYLELEGFGKGATADMTVVLGAGTYRFECYPEDEDPDLGATVRVTGKKKVSGQTPGLQIVTKNDMIPPAQAYSTWIEDQLPTLETQAKTLQSDIAADDTAKAKQDWLTAHLTYETLGAAYDAFGDFDREINGTPASSTTALTDPDLTGFHKIEALLWNPQVSPAQLPALAAGLVTDIAALEQQFPSFQIDPLDMGLRAHEILENALQFELTGKTDAGSHTNLATLDANLKGTMQALTEIAPVLEKRYAKFGPAVSAVTADEKLVEGYRSVAGVWTPLDSLTVSQREALDSHVGSTLELLAPIAAISDIRQAE